MKQRQTELDILRFLATLAVITFHVCGGGIDALPVNTPKWITLNSIYAAVTWQVPVFVMISGRFFLDENRTVSMKQLLGKYIPRLVIAFAFWTVVYQIWAAAYCYATGSGYLNIKGILFECIRGEYHLWYLYMLAGVYLLTPFLRKIAADKTATEYYLVLFFVFHLLESYGSMVPIIGDAVKIVLDKTDFHFALGYSGYYLLGYYLYKHGVADRLEVPLYVTGILMLMFSVCATTIHSIRSGTHMNQFAEYLTPNVMIEAVAIYTFFIKRVGKVNFSDRCRTTFAKLTELGFGIYLSHVFVQKFVNILHFPTTAFPLITVPAATTIVLIFSILLTIGLRKIPYIGKLIT